MSDHADAADKIIEQHRAAAERKARAEFHRPESSPGFDGVHCREPDCGDVIPAARLAMGKTNCVQCQERLERACKFK